MRIELKEGLKKTIEYFDQLLMRHKASSRSKAMEISVYCDGAGSTNR